MQPQQCPDCEFRSDRRAFLQTVGGGLVAGTVLPWLYAGSASAAPTSQSAAETAVAKFFASLSAAQRKEICFPFDHALRKKISANWHITKPTIGDDFYNADQRKLIEEVVRKVTSEEGFERLKRQMADDDAGLESYSVAVFGEPGSGKFEWELTGRHLTLRADGDSVDRAAFGGPIVYGHGVGNPKQNLFFSQTQQVNKVLKALDAKQSDKALIEKAPGESQVSIQGADGKFPGISVSELTSDQQGLVKETLKVLLAPYRQEDTDEVMSLIDAAGGIGKLHFAFYREGDLDKDQVWDIWRIEGPSMVWHFRGAPHVHAYINVALSDPKKPA